MTSSGRVLGLLRSTRCCSLPYRMHMSHHGCHVATACLVGFLLTQLLPFSGIPLHSKLQCLALVAAVLQNVSGAVFTRQPPSVSSLACLGLILRAIVAAS